MIIPVRCFTCGKVCGRVALWARRSRAGRRGEGGGHARRRAAAAAPARGGSAAAAWRARRGARRRPGRPWAREYCPGTPWAVRGDARTAGGRAARRGQECPRGAARPGQQPRRATPDATRLRRPRAPQAVAGDCIWLSRARWRGGACRGGGVATPAGRAGAHRAWGWRLLRLLRVLSRPCAQPLTRWEGGAATRRDPAPCAA